MKLKPTTETYTELQMAYDTFNRLLFENKLPDCLITLQRTKNSFGYFSSDRFSNTAGEKTDEIAMNPTFFAAYPLIEIMQTLVHEQTHLWQHHFGTVGRGRYHNKEWASKMESIGLMPSSTGKPDGKKTGDSVADYPIENGAFLAVCNELFTNKFKISWYDRFPPQTACQAGLNSFSLTLDLPQDVIQIASHNGVDMAQESEFTKVNNSSNRSKYSCACEFNVWGKPSLNLICGDCGEKFDEII